MRHLRHAKPLWALAQTLTSRRRSGKKGAKSKAAEGTVEDKSVSRRFISADKVTQDIQATTEALSEPDSNSPGSSIEPDGVSEASRSDSAWRELYDTLSGSGEWRSQTTESPSLQLATSLDRFVETHDNVWTRLYAYISQCRHTRTRTRTYGALLSTRTAPHRQLRPTYVLCACLAITVLLPHLPSPAPSHRSQQRSPARQYM